ncbi:MAG: proteasome accessory factor PafA2 family protein [Candidatus Eisenbacteria bacterium]|nr:proteasome accessory factor PafA2 family protein [Candidatus Eisenbacteria bacterium]
MKRPIVLPKLCGADVEVANFVEGAWSGSGSGREASRALLREIRGIPGRNERWTRTGGGNGSGRGGVRVRGGEPPAAGEDPREIGRVFLPENGGCAYIDLDHLELCLPEVLDAREHAAAWHAMLRIARSALVSANARRDGERKIRILVNNSDGLGHSYGAHLDFLVARRAYEDIFDRRMQYLLWLASYMVSSIVFTGQGKVGSENGAPAADFQISQRADFFECLVGPQTTYRRPIVNSRDEALVGGWIRGSALTLRDLMARMHVIFYDSTLAYAAGLLKVGVYQVILAMIEAGLAGETDLILEDPLAALRLWSRDLEFRRPARLLSGERLTAVELQRRFREKAARFAERDDCGGAVPGAKEILDLWGETLERLEGRDLSALAPRIDWALKLLILRGAMDAHPELDWGSPKMKMLDHLYSSLDPDEGLFWPYERAGMVEKPVPESAVERFMHEPPCGTRAFTRAMLLRRADPETVESVDWDSIRFRMSDGAVRRTVRLWNPLGFGRSATEPLFRNGSSIEEIVRNLAEGPPV